MLATEEEDKGRDSVGQMESRKIGRKGCGGAAEAIGKNAPPLARWTGRRGAVRVFRRGTLLAYVRLVAVVCHHT